MLSSASDKAKLFVENFSKNSNLDDSGIISLPIFPLKLHNIFVTPKMLEKVIMNFDMSTGCAPDCIPVVFLRNSGPELSYLQA